MRTAINPAHPSGHPHREPADGGLADPGGNRPNPGPDPDVQAQLLAGEDRGMNFFEEDPDFIEVLRLYHEPTLFHHLLPYYTTLGQIAGGRLDELAAIADKNPPTLLNRDRQGRLAQSVETHPAYREMQRIGYCEFGLAAISHRGDVLGWPHPLPHAAKYTMTFLFTQGEFGLYCPISMTDSAARVLRKFGSSDLVARYVPGLTSTDPEHRLEGAMFVTEMGGGSDVRATATIARNEGEQWRLYGEKWFCSNVDADVILTLARPEGAAADIGGLAFFVIPKTLPDGTRNSYRIVRLKDKLGTRGMPTGEVLLEGTVAYLVGEAAGGFKMMAEMVNVSRLSNGVRSAGLMRRAWRDATCAAMTRSAFRRPIIEFPLVKRQLDKIRLYGEQAISFYLFTAEMMQRGDDGDTAAASITRLLTPLLKFRACRDARKVTGDAMEIRGGCGYIEDYVAPRLLRDSHLGSIWEGTSNICALDAIQRAVGKVGAERLLVAELCGRLDAAPMIGDPRSAALLTQMRAKLDRAAEFARQTAAGGDATEHRVREAATGLYRAIAGCLLAIEGAHIAHENENSLRLELAEATLRHHLPELALE